MIRRINVMAPLLVGDPADPDGEASKKAWTKFEEDLAAAKKADAYAVSVDVFWGTVEKQKRVYDWRIYHKELKAIKAAGRKIVLIAAIHACKKGGNIGDDVDAPIADWVWLDAAIEAGFVTVDAAKGIAVVDINAVKYVSEQGNASDDFISCWAVKHVLKHFRAFIEEMQREFAEYADDIVEINISLGPSGELRDPSYNSHDKGAAFPSRGALQCYSKMARASWEKWVLEKYTDKNGVRKSWGEFDKIEPPVDCNAFFDNGVHLNTQYGRDLFDWYHESLIASGRLIMREALDVLTAKDAPFAKKLNDGEMDIGMKFPGVHWRMGHWQDGKIVFGDRLAELAAGLITTSDFSKWSSDDEGHGYARIIGLVKELNDELIAKGSKLKVVLHFTCLEMADLEYDWLKDEPEHRLVQCNSLAYQLARWVGKEAAKQGVTLKGENALACNLESPIAWECMRSALGLPGESGLYQGLTVLRLSDVVGNAKILAMFKATVKAAGGNPEPDAETPAATDAEKSAEEAAKPKAEGSEKPAESQPAPAEKSVAPVA